MRLGRGPAIKYGIVLLLTVGALVLGGSSQSTASDPMVADLFRRPLVPLIVSLLLTVVGVDWWATRHRDPKSAWLAWSAGIAARAGCGGAVVVGGLPCFPNRPIAISTPFVLTNLSRDGSCLGFREPPLHELLDRKEHLMSYATARRRDTNADANKLYSEDRAVHEWYRFVLSFPPHLVQSYLEQFGAGTDSLVLDPFCGTGTTLVECKKRGIPSMGIEGNPMAAFASEVKTTWTGDSDGLMAHALRVAAAATAQLDADGIEDDPLLLPPVDPPLRELAPDLVKLLLTNSISPRPLHKALVLLDCLANHADPRYAAYERLALAKTVVHHSSNIRFGPEAGVGLLKRDAPVLAPWLAQVRAISTDLAALSPLACTPATVVRGDARQVLALLAPASISAVITSPPYPNEKDYTRTTRLESVLLGILRSKADLRIQKQGLVRSNTRTVYKGDDDDRWIAEYPTIQHLAATIEARRLELGKTSGFERLYGTVTKLYFGGMARHLAELRTRLQPGANLAYVVGDQASYFRVLIRTGTLLAEIAERLGYEVVRIDLFRTRLATATKDQLREEVVVLHWPGSTSSSTL